ncbi:MAG TPA: thiamine phosphate synthase [Thermoanaerobaculia bacterium]|jgi:thiamine-phosphate pyrophosphorylase|nr:thiamine phosphate synthase [Thermoanaerobaculia bacterium]
MRSANGASGTIYAIADVEALNPTPLSAAVRDMADAGIRWIQVRAKRLSGGELFRQLEVCCRVLDGSGVDLWVDDRADLAALFPLAGVHVGQTDLPPAAVRRVVGPEVRIGLSTHGEEQLLAAAADPDVDVIAVGPVFPTTGKDRPDPVVGVGFVRWARGRTAKPLVAIGGIGEGNVREVLDAGADAAAVIGAMCRGGDVKANALRLLAAAEQTGCGSI